MRHGLTSPATIYAWTATAFAGTPAALFALDAALAGILRTTTQPIVGQMRLTWWYEALARLDDGAPAQPELQALARHPVPTAALTRMVEGWEALLEEPLDAGALARHAARGQALFGALGSGDDAVLAAGRGWALADAASHLSDRAAAQQAHDLAVGALDDALATRWRTHRAVGALALDARLALTGRGEAGSPRRGARVLRFGLTGR